MAGGESVKSSMRWRSTQLRRLLWILRYSVKQGVRSGDKQQEDTAESQFTAQWSREEVEKITIDSMGILRNL